MSSIGRDSSIFIGRGESKEQTRDKNLDRQKKSHVTTYSGALLNMLSSFSDGRRTAQTSPNVQLPEAGRLYSILQEGGRGSHLPDMRFTRPWFSWSWIAFMSQNSLVDDSVISATMMDLIVGLVLGSSCVHALASIVNCVQGEPCVSLTCFTKHRKDGRGNSAAALQCSVCGLAISL